MTVYLQHTFYSIGIPETGHVHNRNAPPEDETPTAIDCDLCEPYLVKNAGAVYDTRLLPPTQAQAERAERESGQGSTAAEIGERIAEALEGRPARRGRKDKAAAADGPEVRVVVDGG